MKKLWEILTWVPPDLWEDYLGNASLALHSWFWAWILGQVSRLVSLLMSFCLVLPTEFVQSGGFTKLYAASIVLSFAVLRGGVGIKVLRTLWGKRGKFNIRDSYGLVFRSFVAVSLITLAPKLFTLIAAVSANIASSLAPLVRLDLSVAPLSGTEELSLVIFVVVIGANAVRLLVYYAIRNVYMLVLLLALPAAAFRWAATGKQAHLEKLAQEMGGLLLVQIIHVFLFILMVQLGEHPGRTHPVFWNLLTQIGAMQLMLKTDTLLDIFLGLKLPNTPTEQTEQILEFLKTKGASLFEG